MKQVDRIKLDKDGTLTKKVESTDPAEGCAAGESLLTSDLANKWSNKWLAPTVVGKKGSKK